MPWCSGRNDYELLNILLVGVVRDEDEGLGRDLFYGKEEIGFYNLSLT